MTSLAFHISVVMYREEEGEGEGEGGVGDESTWLPNIQDVANNVCSPLQRQGAYIHIGYSL